MEIEITDGANSQVRELKSGVSLEKAISILELLYDDDYLGLTYNLWIKGEIYKTLEPQINDS